MRNHLLARWTAVCSLLLATAARGMEPQCPTWFPDLAGCERSGRYPGFTAPVTEPYLFEDPFITTGAQFYGIWHQFPKDSALGGGSPGLVALGLDNDHYGHLWVVALQLRLAITERLAFIASKDGYAWHRPANPLLPNEDGLYDLAFGLKYAAIEDRERNFIFTPMLRFDVPTGENKVFQGNGDGVIQPGFAAAWGAGDFHGIVNFGFRVPFDLDKETTSLFYNLHLDYRVWEHLAPFVEFNGYSYIAGGDGRRKLKTTIGSLTVNQAQAALLTGPFEGVDVANLGSMNVEGRNILTFAVGTRIPINEHLSLGAAYEFPVTSRRDVFRQRVTMSALLEF